MNMIIAVLRQAGACYAIMPHLSSLMGLGCDVKVIAFEVAYKVCLDIMRDAGSMPVKLANSEVEARSIFNESLPHARLLITGTSFESKYDAFYWRKARELKIESIAYVDQWSNLEERFLGLESCEFPNEICVIDSLAHQALAKIIPSDTKINVVGSPILTYLEDYVFKDRKNYQEENTQDITLFCSEPCRSVKDQRHKYGFCDEDSFIMAYDYQRRYHQESTFLIRLHPTDRRERWLRFLDEGFTFGWDEDSKIQSLIKASRVFGMTSFYLLEALAVGTEVISFQPNKKSFIPLTDGRMRILTHL